MSLQASAVGKWCLLRWFGFIILGFSVFMVDREIYLVASFTVGFEDNSIRTPIYLLILLVALRWTLRLGISALPLNPRRFGCLPYCFVRASLQGQQTFSLNLIMAVVSLSIQWLLAYLRFDVHLFSFGSWCFRLILTLFYLIRWLGMRCW